VLVSITCLVSIARVGEYNICVGEYNIYQCVICVFEHNIRVGQNGICISEYIITYVLLFTFCNIVYDNDFFVGERYRAVTSYKYFRTKIFPCIFYMKAFFL
jgi:hypothetical protein